jgi:pilus assembly protein CpaC
MLKCKIVSIDRTALTQIGFNLFSTNSVMAGATSTQQYQQPLFSQLQTQNGGKYKSNSVNFSDLLNLFLFRPDLGIGATIAALQQQNIAQILAEPNLITVEGKEASFLVGGQFPFPVITSTPTGAGIAPVITIQWKKFGVQLNFTPTVTPQGSIDLQVTPEVSALDYTDAVTIEGYLIPALSSRTAQTEVVLKDGETFAIAGLIDNRVTQEIDKTPILGDIPILGNLFKSRSTQKTSTELLVVVTPNFVKPLTPDEKAKLPDMIVPFLPPISTTKDYKKTHKKDANDKDSNTPATAGQTGYAEPK